MHIQGVHLNPYLVQCVDKNKCIDKQLTLYTITTNVENFVHPCLHTHHFHVHIDTLHHVPDHSS